MKAIIIMAIALCLISACVPVPAHSQSFYIGTLAPGESRTITFGIPDTIIKSIDRGFYRTPEGFRDTIIHVPAHGYFVDTTQHSNADSSRSNFWKAYSDTINDPKHNDTTRVIMLVCDTSWITSYTSYYKSEKYQDSRDIYWQYGYVLRSYWGSLFGYLDEHKKPLDKSIVIWNFKVQDKIR